MKIEEEEVLQGLEENNRKPKIGVCNILGSSTIWKKERKRIG